MAIQAELKKLGLDLSSEQCARLQTYVEELERWNRRMNLTALHGSGLIQRLIAEPIWLGRQLEISESLLDIGSGNGCPAIPLCVARSLQTAHLVESRQKRAAFLRHIASRLQLKQITVHERRFEAIEAAEISEEIRWVTLQAVRPTPELVQRMKQILPSTTQVVWITSAPQPPCQDARQQLVPGSNTRAWIFRLDQF